MQVQARPEWAGLIASSLKAPIGVIHHAYDGGMHSLGHVEVMSSIVNTIMRQVSMPQEEEKVEGHHRNEVTVTNRLKGEAANPFDVIHHHVSIGSCIIPIEGIGMVKIEIVHRGHA